MILKFLLLFFSNNIFNYCTNENDRFVDKFRKLTFRRLFFFKIQIIYNEFEK